MWTSRRQHTRTAPPHPSACSIAYPRLVCLRALRIAVPPIAVTEAERRRYSQAYEELKRRYNNLDTLLDAAHSTVSGSSHAPCSSSSTRRHAHSHLGYSSRDVCPRTSFFQVLSLPCDGQTWSKLFVRLHPSRCTRDAQPELECRVGQMQHCALHHPLILLRMQQLANCPWPTLDALAAGICARDGDCCRERPAKPSGART